MICTLAELRGHIVTGLSDDDLRDLMDAAEQDITEAAGPVETVTEYHYVHGHSKLVLDHKPLTITTVVEDTDGANETLDEATYRVDGYLLERIDAAWTGRVAVTMARPDDWASRKRAQVALIKLHLAFSGYSAEATQDESRSPMPNYVVQRAGILDALSTTSSVMAR